MAKKRKDSPKRDKGSYRHMLDLVSSPNFENIINELLEGTSVELAVPDCRHPTGRTDKKDWTEMELEEYLLTHKHPEDISIAADWWFPYKTNRNRRPTWDLICHVRVRGEPGLLIVEAKAHVGELSEQDKKKRPDIRKPRRMANDYSIRLRLGEASLALTKLNLGEFRLSADHHYQFANRLAYLHKLASDGVPTVLMYLGWLQSSDWPDDPFEDSGHWEQTVRDYMNGVAPSDFLGHECSIEHGTTMQMIVRSLRADTVG